MLEDYIFDDHLRYEQEVIGDDWGYIAAELEQLAPAIVPKKRDVRQELELDNILPIPPERNYVKVREYIIERCKYDKNFETVMDYVFKSEGGFRDSKNDLGGRTDKGVTQTTYNAWRIRRRSRYFTQ